MERKTVKFDVKAIDEETGVIEGYASTFSKNPDAYGDIVDPGAFTKTLKENGDSVVCLFNHDVMEPIGLPELKQDKTGLYAKINLVMDIQRARDVLALAKAGVIKRMSIGYDTVKSDMVGGVRHLKEIRLYDVSPVVFPANPEAVILSAKDMRHLPDSDLVAVEKSALEEMKRRVGEEFGDATDIELKPYPSEHACRLRDPDDFESDSFRRTTREHDGKEYSVISGRLKGETTLTEQAYRYDRDTWSEVEAKSHCDDHDGMFEAAKQEEFNCECIKCGHKVTSSEHCSEIKCPKCGSEMRRAERPGPGKSLKSGRVLSAASLTKVRAAIEALQALLEAAEGESEPEKSTHLSEASKGAVEIDQILEDLGAQADGFDARKAEARIDALLSRLREN